MYTLTLQADAIIRMFSATIPHLAARRDNLPTLEFVRVAIRHGHVVATATDRYTVVVHAEITTDTDDRTMFFSLDEAKAAIALAKASAPTAQVTVYATQWESMGTRDYPTLRKLVVDEGYELGAGMKPDSASFLGPDQMVKIDKTRRALKLSLNDLWPMHRPETGFVRFDVGTKTRIWVMPRTHRVAPKEEIVWEGLID